MMHGLGRYVFEKQYPTWMPTTALDAVMPSRVVATTLGDDVRYAISDLYANQGLGRSDSRFISATSPLEMMFATQYLIWSTCIWYAVAASLCSTP